MRAWLRQCIVLFACALSATLLLYGNSVNLPLYMDDVVFGRYIEGVGALELFTRLDSVPYYRPLSNLPWKAVIMATGGFHPGLFHALNVSVHATNGLLVGILALRVLRARDNEPPYFAAVTSVILYVLFPFSYQAVGWAAALGHLMATMGALVAIIAVVSIDEKNPPGWRDALWIGFGTTVAVFSHENGAAVPLLAFAFRLLRTPRGSRGRSAVDIAHQLLPLLPTLAVVAVYVLIWFALPKARPDGISTSPADWIANATYFVQGIGYPLAQVGGWIWKTFGFSREVVALVLGLLGAAGALWLAGRRGRPGIVWYSLAISVPTFLLQSAYAIDGPRLMTMASPGAALLWAAAADGLRRRALQASIPIAVSRLTAYTLVGAIAFSGAAFVSGRMALHEQMSTLYHGLFAAAAEEPTAVIINLPAWLAFRDEWYALGSEGVTYMTEYVDLDDLVYVNTNVRPNLVVGNAEGALPAQEVYWWGIQRADSSGTDIATSVTTGGSGYIFAIPGGYWAWESLRRVDALGERTPAQRFMNGTVLTVNARGDNPGLIEVTLEWQTAGSLPESAFVHAVCAGELVSQADGSPLRSVIGFEALPAQAIWREVRWMPLSEQDRCQVRVGLYDPVTGVRELLADGREWIDADIE